MLKGLFKSTLEQMLEAEMDEHLGYDKHSPIGNNSGNSRKGYSKKTVKSSLGETEIVVPRDRKSEFEPQLLEKRQTRSNDLGNRIIAMYAKGMSNRDIEDHLHNVYGVDASASLISRITDKILPAINEWQVRPLENVYPIVFLDGIVFKVRKDARVINKCLYSVLGINMDGRKKILGIWISENESASFWVTVCNDLRNRGVQDILIACRDNLTGFSNAIETVLKKVYGAVTIDNAEYGLLEFEEKWGKKYPQIIKSWRTNWTELTTYFKYPQEVRTLIYTTNAVEGFHRMLRKYTKTIYPTDDAVKKSVYLSI